MTTAQVVEKSVTVNNNSTIQGYVHPDDHTQPTWHNCIILWIEIYPVDNITHFKQLGLIKNGEI